LIGILVALERRLSDQNLDEQVDDDFSVLQDDEKNAQASSTEPSPEDWFSLGVTDNAKDMSTNSSSEGSAVEYFTPPAPLLESPPFGRISDLIKHDLYACSVYLIIFRQTPKTLTN